MKTLQRKGSRELRRRRVRGAVFVEAILVITGLIAIFVGFLYLKDAYGARLSSMRQARRESWTGSLAGCGGGGGSLGQPDGSLAGATGQLLAAKMIAHGPSLGRSLDPRLTVSATSATRSVRSRTEELEDVSPGVLPALRMTTTNAVLCNEVPSDVSLGDVRMTIETLYPALLGGSP